jgi:NADP-dependent aldehyde dehydrogenase
VANAVRDAELAFERLRQMSAKQRAGVLEALASAATRQREPIIATCADETALTPDELAPEFDRMVGTLRMFADLVREGSWGRAAIDTQAAPGQSIGPGHDVRSMLVPLGPVAVFGASNFPLAYGVLGGDTASAIAAGCPVVVKEHPAHPKTGRLLAEIARDALAHGTPGPNLVQYVRNEDPRDRAVAEALVRSDGIRAVGFTGSTSGGRALERLARERSVPIPVFAEMGSMNLVIVLRNAFRVGAERIVEELAASLLARHGQQCTAPGMILVRGDRNAEWVFGELSRRVLEHAPRRMLSAEIATAYRRRVEEVLASGAVWKHAAQRLSDQDDPRVAPAMVLRSEPEFLENAPTAWREIFGPAVIVAEADAFAIGRRHAESRLVTTVYGDTDDLLNVFRSDYDADHFGLSESLTGVREHAGRITFNTVPTGVRVATAMVHGGPFPATNAPHTTAVGPRAIERWCRPVCFQNCPDALLPDELKNANPRGIWRMLDGVFTRDAL